ncbi:MAG: hypothetical protein LGB78_08205 [Sulfurovum sp.]|nr:hypothetical protein [Sulfurovum sp.]MCB4773579.1 hypothetical protein [Sulfurovum sp.]MCB4781080.1 hypothetical protein [Sulfurovum sp.]MCB4784258.1 hypothetical protein [Sulfurovum sp.]
MGKFIKGLKAFGSGFKESRQQKKEKDIDFKIKETEIELQNKKVSHILHFLLSVVTAGIWIVVWILITISVSSEKSALKKKLKEFYSIRENKFESMQKSELINFSKTVNLNEKDKKELKNLMELKELGVLTTNEFEEKKQNILNNYT